MGGPNELCTAGSAIRDTSMFDAARHWLLTLRTQASPSGRRAAPVLVKVSERGRTLPATRSFTKGAAWQRPPRRFLTGTALGNGSPESLLAWRLRRLRAGSLPSCLLCLVLRRFRVGSHQAGENHITVGLTAPWPRPIARARFRWRRFRLRGRSAPTALHFHAPCSPRDGGAVDHHPVHEESCGQDNRGSASGDKSPQGRDW